MTSITLCSIGTQLYFAVSEAAKVITEYENGALPASPTREYLYSGSQLLTTVEGSATKYHHGDHLSVRVTTDSTGTVIGQQGHLPFGDFWYESGTGTTKWKFTSYERDAESGSEPDRSARPQPIVLGVLGL